MGISYTKTCNLSRLQDKLEILSTSQETRSPCLRRQVASPPPRCLALFSSLTFSSPTLYHETMVRILIADDDLVNTKIYATKLKNEGCEVVLSPDGESAKKEICQKFDVILLDIMMPKIDGVVLLDEVKKGINKTTPILVHSNLIDEQTKKQCLQLGAKEFLLKADYTPTEVVEKIKGYLHGKI